MVPRNDETLGPIIALQIRYPIRKLGLVNRYVLWPVPGGRLQSALKGTKQPPFISERRGIRIPAPRTSQKGCPTSSSLSQ